jgi:hypothetical protein
MKNMIQSGVSVKLLSIDSFHKSLSLFDSLANFDGLGRPRNMLVLLLGDIRSVMTPVFSFPKVSYSGL